MDCGHQQQDWAWSRIRLCTPGSPCPRLCAGIGTRSGGRPPPPAPSPESDGPGQGASHPLGKVPFDGAAPPLPDQVEEMGLASHGLQQSLTSAQRSLTSAQRSLTSAQRGGGRDVLERPYTVGGGGLPSPPLPGPLRPPPPPPVPMFGAESQNFASAPSVPRGFNLRNFWPAFGREHRGTSGGGGSQPTPFRHPPLPSPPSNTSLGGGLMHAQFGVPWEQVARSPVSQLTGLCPPPPLPCPRAGSVKKFIFGKLKFRRGKILAIFWYTKPSDLRPPLNSHLNGGGGGGWGHPIPYPSLPSAPRALPPRTRQCGDGPARTCAGLRSPSGFGDSVWL